jgi:hypothetical protein
VSGAVGVTVIIEPEPFRLLSLFWGKHRIATRRGVIGEPIDVDNPDTRVISRCNDSSFNPIDTALFDLLAAINDIVDA